MGRNELHDKMRAARQRHPALSAGAALDYAVAEIRYAAGLPTWFEIDDLGQPTVHNGALVRLATPRY